MNQLLILLLVVGGMLCCMLVSYPLIQVRGLGRIARRALNHGGQDAARIVTFFIAITNKAKDGGFLALQEDVSVIKDDFVRRALQFVLDGCDQEYLNAVLETEIRFARERHGLGQRLFSSLGAYALACGVLGTILNLIAMSGAAGDLSRAAIPIAFGLGLSCLIFMPIHCRLRRLSEEEMLIMEIVARGAILLQCGAAPSTMGEHLKAYLEPDQRAMVRDRTDIVI